MGKVPVPTLNDHLTEPVPFVSLPVSRRGCPYVGVCVSTVTYNSRKRCNPRLTLLALLFLHRLRLALASLFPIYYRAICSTCFASSVGSKFGYT